MSKRRSRTEIEVLAAEAERRVRAGQSLTEVSRVLEVSRNTLFDWAAKGGWRQKDIYAEQAGEEARLAQERIAAIRRREEEAEQARAQLAEAIERARSRTSGRTGGSGSGGSSGYQYSRQPMPPAESAGRPAPALDAAQLAEAIEYARSRASGRTGGSGSSGSAGYQYSRPPLPTSQSGSQGNPT